MPWGLPPTIPPELAAVMKRANPAPAMPGMAPGASLGIPPGAFDARFNSGINGPVPQSDINRARGVSPMTNAVTGTPLPPAAITMGPGGVNMNPPPKPPPGMVPGMGIPSAPAPKSAAIPPVTDDPAVTSGSMGAVPKPPNLSQYLTPMMSQMQQDQQGYRQADEAHRMNPQQLKPKLWERLVGFALGATQLKDPSNAGNVAGEVTNRRWNQAQRERDTALQPWQERMKADQEGLPMANAAGETAYREGMLNLDTAKENRERVTGQGRIDLEEEKVKRLQDQIDNPKEVLPKNADEALAAASAASNPAEKSRLIRLAQDLHKQEIERAQQSRPPKEEKPKSTVAQSKGANDKKNAALAKAQQVYDKATAEAGTDPVARAAAEEEFRKAEQAAQDAFEQDVAILGGTPGHQDVSSWKGQGAQPSATAATQSEVPKVMGPTGETPTKTAFDGKTRIGYYASTKQWMLMPAGGK